jgi:hypothetical protein
VFEQAKTVHALDRTATVIGIQRDQWKILSILIVGNAVQVRLQTKTLYV